MNNSISAFLSIFIFLSSCGSRVQSGKIIPSQPKKDVNSEYVYANNPNVNVFIENSGSMDGYVKGVTEFEQAVYNYLTDVKISGFTDSLNLFYVNSKIIPQGSDVSDFIENLEPAIFKKRGGNRGISDISNVFKLVLAETKFDDVSILVTDGIFSPGKGKDADQYLINQQIGIKQTMADFLKENDNTAVIIYQLSSKFDGDYYNREDIKTYLKAQRPFYIWIIGNVEFVDKLVREVPTNKFKGSGIQNVFSISSGKREVDYAVKMGSGKFDLDKVSPKTTIKNLQKDTRGRQNEVRFSFNANLSGFLLSDKYLNDTLNYELSNKAYNLTVNKAVGSVPGFTHTLNLRSENVHKGILSIRLISQIPEWVEEVNDIDGSNAIEGKTYGIKYQIHGIYEAFTIRENIYTEMKINIK